MRWRRTRTPCSNLGERLAVDLLWRATYALDAWSAVVHGRPPNTLLIAK